jgi:hypothetical protein
MTSAEKRKAALDAIEEYQLYAATNAVVIANDAVTLLKASGHMGLPGTLSLHPTPRRSGSSP